MCLHQGVYELEKVRWFINVENTFEKAGLHNFSLNIVFYILTH